MKTTTLLFFALLCAAVAYAADITYYSFNTQDCTGVSSSLTMQSGQCVSEVGTSVMITTKGSTTAAELWYVGHYLCSYYDLTVTSSVWIANDSCAGTAEQCIDVNNEECNPIDGGGGSLKVSWTGSASTLAIGSLLFFSVAVAVLV